MTVAVIVLAAALTGAVAALVVVTEWSPRRRRQGERVGHGEPAPRRAERGVPSRRGLVGPRSSARRERGPMGRGRSGNRPGPGAGRVLFPFVAQDLSPRALDAALRLARVDEAMLVPVFLAVVPLRLPLSAPLPRQSAIALPLQEAIEQRAVAFGVTVDARIERGRSHRHALRQTIADERFDRIVVAAAAAGCPGFGPDDVAWLLANAPGEIVVLRPQREERIAPPTAAPSASSANARARGWAVDGGRGRPSDLVSARAG